MDDIKELLPPLMFDRIRDRYLAGVADAEAFFSQSAADEDSLTGALGQAIATRPMIFKGTDGDVLVAIEYLKIRGRGAGAPEATLGADGIFQIRVLDAAGSPIREKGLLFQAKKGWKHRDQDLASQCRSMIRASGGGMVINYGPSGYEAFSAQAVIDADGRRDDAEAARRPLGHMLGDDFLDCTIGTAGLTYESLSLAAPATGFEVIDTQIRGLPRQRRKRKA